MIRWGAVVRRRGSRDGGCRYRRALLSVTLTEHLFKCFEHGHLVNWLRNVRRGV
ncbi:Unknown protein sequence [Pseudomonas coronafaciens pv. oryzae]|nr:Unknown protein sequence [Pseudomonas coronafaciens pv. oryzae]